MAQDSYDYYLQMHERQLTQMPHHHAHYSHHYHLTNLGPSPNTAPPSYELTTGSGAGPSRGGGDSDGASTSGCGEASASNSHHDPRKRKTQTYSSGGYDDDGSDLSCQPGPASRRRKSSYGGSTYEEDGNEDSRSTRTLPDKKQNHSEIEKRRRDKMNTYITELSAMVPMCRAMARKLDKLTVLRMAVQHLRSVRGAITAGPLTARPRPSFLSERELNELVLQAAHDCFLLVVGCDRGRLLYVSTSVNKMLHFDRTELLGQSLFDLLHPKDVAKVKEQLSSSDLSPRERLIDAKTMLPVKPDVVSAATRLCTGARRSFFCRVKCRVEDRSGGVKEETEVKMRKKQHSERKYCVMQCTGYLKSWAPAEVNEPGTGSMESGNEGGEDGEACNLSCLVAVARALPDLAPHAPDPSPGPSTSAAPHPPLAPNTRLLQYVSRHAMDGKFIFVDQRVTQALGFLPQELLGTSVYEYVTGPELSYLARAHKAALLRRAPMHTPPYAFRRKDGSFARVQTHFKHFHNPWTRDVECLVANNTIVTGPIDANSPDGTESYDIFKHEADLETQRLIDSQVESHKIGSAIAEEVLRRSSPEFSPDLSGDLLHDAVFNQQVSLVDNILGSDSTGFSEVRNNVTLSSAGAEGSPPPGPSGLGASQSTPPASSPPLPPLGLDGNGEAAMAVIMNLLEADAGLGGPVNLTGLPWLLP